MTTTEPILAPGHAEQIKRRAEALPLPTLFREAKGKRYAAARALTDWLAASYAAEADILFRVYLTRTDTRGLA